MRKLSVLGIAVLGLAMAMPAMADELYAVSKLTSAPQQQMTDSQLNKVEGAVFCGICAFSQRNHSWIYQSNSATQVNAASINGGNQLNGVSQANGAIVIQSNH
jgi:prolyl-tRNA editing enzyme YbaK/EbsC (Cys-tRNA(Pro) deacylase)